MRTLFTPLKILLIASLIQMNLMVQSQSIDSLKEQFTVIKKIDATPVKNQGRTLTCWSFSVIAMMESELFRSGKGEYNLSEMYIVHQAYIEKAEKFVRMHGDIIFGEGGALNDPVEIIKKYGIVPESVYTGLKDGSSYYNHSELFAVLKDYVMGIIKNKNISPRWKEGFIGILDAYLGKVPEKFTYNGKEYTPLSFAKMLGINPDNYILFSSFTHHPYFQKFIVEVPDNWSWGQAYNLPLEDLQRVVDHSLEKGYSCAIATDVSEKGFQWKKGIALAYNEPENNNDNGKSNDPSIWIPEKDTTKTTFKEINVTAQLRQLEFDTYETTDDHGMQIMGFAKNQNGEKFYLVKNSWGTEVSPYKGYLYLSDSYFRFKTLTVLVNKNGLPSDVIKKLGL
jgi:bleomycin hydrolase